MDSNWGGTLRPDRCGFVVERTPDRTVINIAARNDLNARQRKLLLETALRFGRQAIVSVAFRLNAPLPTLKSMIEHLPPANRLRCCVFWVGGPQGDADAVSLLWFYPVELHQQLFVGLAQERVLEMLGRDG